MKWTDEVPNGRIASGRGRDTWLKLIGCACDKCLMLGAGEWPPDDPGGAATQYHDRTHNNTISSSSDDDTTTGRRAVNSDTSEEYLTPAESPVRDTSFPLSPGQWPALATRPSHARTFDIINSDLYCKCTHAVHLFCIFLLCSSLLMKYKSTLVAAHDHMRVFV